MNFKEIKQALGRTGKSMAGDMMDQYLERAGHPFGAEFTVIVNRAVVNALQGIGVQVNGPVVVNANTANAVASWLRP